MEKDRITSRPRLIGNISHYDSCGSKVGSSNLDLFSANHYDTHGHKTGNSYSGLCGSTKTNLDKRNRINISPWS